MAGVFPSLTNAAGEYVQWHEDFGHVSVINS